jgi:hypothetical protein
MRSRRSTPPHLSPLEPGHHTARRGAARRLVALTVVVAVCTAVLLLLTIGPLH